MPAEPGRGAAPRHQKFPKHGYNKLESFSMECNFKREKRYLQVSTHNRELEPNCFSLNWNKAIRSNCHQTEIVAMLVAAGGRAVMVSVSSKSYRTFFALVC